jgi:hypothetical protein
MSSRLENSVMERLEHRPCTFWYTEEDDFSGLDTSPATEGEIYEDICVTFEDFCRGNKHGEMLKNKE